MYADSITDSMRKAITETNRRRKIQNDYNVANNITPKTIIKELKMPENLVNKQNSIDDYLKGNKKLKTKAKEDLIRSLEKEMKQAAKDLDFEQAASLRDIILELKNE